MKKKRGWVFLAIISGILAALAFPKFNLSFLIWLAPIPLLFILYQSGPKKAFFAGWLAGLAFYGLLLYWLPYVPTHYGNLPFTASLFIYFLLISFLALFWAVFAWLQARIIRCFPSFGFILAGFLWVSLEYLLTFFLTGFPWGLLGYAQAFNLPLIQVATITGVYGVSFIIILFASSFVDAFIKRKRTPFFLCLIFILFLHFIGFIQLKRPLSSPENSSFIGAVIQGNVSSNVYWDYTPESEIERLFEAHLQLTQEAINRGARLVIWPEFSVPLCFSCSEQRYVNFRKRLEKLVQETGATLLLGTNERTSEPEKTEFYNTALCLNPDLSITTYHKMHLVPFGEYTPYKKFFNFIEKITHAIGDITPGREHRLHSFQGLAFGSPICYEIIFPDLVRRFVKLGATFLVTITNDGWYGRSAAPYQHFQIALFRAIENRRYLLRSATTGISGIIDPLGRVIKRSTLMTVDVLEATVKPMRKTTFYTRYGDIWSQLCLTLSLLFVIFSLFKK